jgi:hypothetical protein
MATSQAYIEGTLTYCESAEVRPIGTDWCEYIERKLRGIQIDVQALIDTAKLKPGPVQDNLVALAEGYQARIDAVMRKWGLLTEFKYTYHAGTEPIERAVLSAGEVATRYPWLTSNLLNLRYLDMVIDEVQITIERVAA